MNLKKFKDLFDCDTARLSVYKNMMYLVIGFRERSWEDLEYPIVDENGNEIPGSRTDGVDFANMHNRAKLLLYTLLYSKNNFSKKKGDNKTLFKLGTYEAKNTTYVAELPIQELVNRKNIKNIGPWFEELMRQEGQTALVDFLIEILYLLVLTVVLAIGIGGFFLSCLLVANTAIKPSFFIIPSIVLALGYGWLGVNYIILWCLQLLYNVLFFVALTFKFYDALLDHKLNSI